MTRNRLRASCWWTSACTVIGAASRQKLAAVTGFGADHAVDYTIPGWPDRVRELTGGRGASLVLDAVGGETAASDRAAKNKNELP